MAFHLDSNRICCLYSNPKRCFSLLLLLNCFLALIFYFYQKNQIINKQNYTRSLATVYHNRTLSNPIEYLRNVLEQEYDHQDLQKFYQLVEKEFSLGLRCMRKSNQPIVIMTTTTQMNTNETWNTTQDSSNTTSSRLPVSTVSSIVKFVRRPKRRTLYSFKIANSNACTNESIDLIIIIISKSDNYKIRDAIRRTWGSGKNLGNYSIINVKFVFLIDLDEKLRSNIRLENNLFHDIIQVELPQQYTLVTHRVLSLFEWSFRYCRTAKYLFKTDDDIFINLVLLLKFLLPSLNRQQNHSFAIRDMNIYGYKHYHPRVFRQANDPVGARYVVTEDEFPCGNYPDFLSGFGYLISRKARDALVYASFHDYETPFRISDVYLTGILPDYLSLERHPMSDYTIRYQGNCENFFNQRNAFACAAGLHHGDTSDVFEKFNRYWQIVKKSV